VNTEAQRQPTGKITTQTDSLRYLRYRSWRAGTFDIGAALCLLAATGLLFGLLFNRETALSYSIGYNLYGAERVLNGEVPYRDFHTLYPPATVYLNAVVFKLLGVRLYSALLAVFVFKTLATAAIYLAGRQVMPRAWAIVAALYSVVWLRPNGPFKAVPMHYGALLLAVGLCCLLRYQRSGRIYWVLGSGVAMGLLALFKHNIGAYALVGFLACLVFDVTQEKGITAGDLEGASDKKNGRRAVCRGGEDGKSLGGADEKSTDRVDGKAGAQATEGMKAVASRERKLTVCATLVVAMILGVAVTVVPVLAYLSAQGAIRPMIRALLFGPGEFLVSRLAGAPSLVAAAIVFGGLVVFGYGVYCLRFNRAVSIVAGACMLAAVGLFCLLGRESWVSGFLFYGAMFIVAAGASCLVFRKHLGEYARPVGLIVVAAAAAFMETFPRFAREQVIAAMPFVGLLLIYLVYSLWRVILPKRAGRQYQMIALLAVLPMMFLLLGFRFFHQTFFRGTLTLRSDTELSIERGRGVYFPSDTAREIDEVTRYIQQHVGGPGRDHGDHFANAHPQDGYVFAQSYAGSSYLFLADRKNPSGAQFWGGVGVSPEERAATLEALEEKKVGMIITSARDLDAEKYQPMRDYIARNFTQAVQIGDVVILERRVQ